MLSFSTLVWGSAAVALLAAGCGAPAVGPVEAPCPPIGKPAEPPNVDRAAGEAEGARNCAGAGLKACGQTPAFVRADAFMVAGNAKEIGALGWFGLTTSGPGCMRFARQRTEDLSSVMLSGCLGAKDPRPLALAAMSTGFLLASRAGYEDKTEGPHDIHVQALVEGGTALGTPLKFPAQSFTWRDQSGGGPVLSDARLVRGAGDRALLAYTSGLETWGALLDATGKPVWGPKLIPAQLATPRSPSEVGVVPYFGGVTAVPSGFLLVRYAASESANGYNWIDRSTLFVTHIDLAGRSKDQPFPQLPSGARLTLLAEGERGAAALITKERKHWLVRMDESGNPRAPLPVAFPHIPTFHAGYAFAHETWLIASDYGSDHASTTRSKVLLYRVANDGAILERREVSALTSDINEQASLFRSGDRLFASWKSGGFFMRRLALAEVAAPGLQVVAAGD